jgi:aryl-alcohol dehydrogenase-like predicted oxidoreductase
VVVAGIDGTAFDSVVYSPAQRDISFGPRRARSVGADCMLVRDLGATRLKVSRLGLGLAALGRPSYINLGRDEDLGEDRSVAAMERRCHEVLDAAQAAGIRYFDAARSYGLAESFLASWLRARGVPPGVATIGSKWGYRYTADWQPGAAVHEVKDLSAANLLRQIDESRAILGAHLQLYQIHSATIESGVLDDAAVLDELARLRSEGLAIGLTVTGPRQADTIRQAMEVEARGVCVFQSIQATWNLLEPSAGDALREAHAAGLGIIVKEALANGRLTDGYAGEEAAAVREAASASGLSTAVLAMAAALAQPWADVVLTGAATVDQIRSNVAALDCLDRAEALPRAALSSEEYWRSRARMGWR